MLGLDHDTLDILQIDDLKRGLSDDHAVAGAESVWHHVGEVQALLDEHLRISTRLPHVTQPLLNEGHVVIRQGTHLLVMPIRYWFRGRRVMQGKAQLPLRKLVSRSSLLGSLRGGFR